MAIDQQKSILIVKNVLKTMQVTVAFLFVAVACATSVYAAFTATLAINQNTTSSATLQPATSLSGTGGCQSIIIGPKITLSWTATSSTFATGYQVYRSSTNGGPYAQIGSVSGRATVTYVDTTVTGLNTTYYFVLKSVYLNWTSVNSNQATATTPVLCL